uniref:Uncharacterized protein n=1 Tax=Schlesneria paludicola TaxID=360056 RepID=A0A7C2JYN2_9PLAN
MSVIHEVGDALRSLFALLPLPFVRAAFVAVPLVLMIWVLRLPNAATTPPGRASRWDENLKLWAWLALAMQVVIYCVF